ncbi:MAG: 3'-5' exonuclease [Desulfurivibrionaceae bacterium]|nr:3'-5' exonuclease [Desulfurivibrionaceae bacterium]
MKLLKLFKKDRRELHPLLARNRQAFLNFEKDLPLHDYDMVVLDTELTGLNVKKDEIVAIGAVKIRNLRIQCAETFYALVRPDEQLHTPSTLLHRITPNELQAAGKLREILPAFLEFCGEAIQIGHYLRLDLEFLNAAARDLLGGTLSPPYLDTMRLAMAYNEARHGHYYEHSNIHGAYTLDALSKEFGLPSFPAHNALNDSLQTAYLFLYLVKKMKDYGFRTLDDYLKAGRKWKIIL